MPARPRHEPSRDAAAQPPSEGSVPPPAADGYVAEYVDARGVEPITLHNDGETLSTVIRSVSFSGADFDDLEPAEGTAPSQLSAFTLNGRSLCACRIRCDIPIAMVNQGMVSAGLLHVTLALGGPSSGGGIDQEKLSIVLVHNGQRIAGTGKTGWFEDELMEIQRQLPEGIFMKACINCLYSDYSPCGHGLFGTMMCFRNLKSEYLKVRSKQDFWGVHGRQDRMVQETYLCDQFERRVPSTGYRG